MMKFLPLVWSGLRRKPTRSIFTLLSIVTAFFLLGILGGVDGFFDYIRDNARLDRLETNSKFGGPLPLSYLWQIARVPGVTIVAPHGGIGGYYQDPKNGMGAVAADERFFAAYPEITVAPEDIATLTRTRTGAIASIALAKKYNWHVGDKISIQSQRVQKSGSKTWTFDIVGLCDYSTFPGLAQFLVINYDYLDLARATDSGKVDGYTLRIDDPQQAAEISATIDRYFASSTAPTRTVSEKANAQSGLQSLGDVSFLTHAVGSAVLFMLLFLTGNSMMQSVRERIPEFGVLKTLGFSDDGVFAVVLAESAVTFSAGAAIGLTLAKIATIAIKNLAKMPPIPLPPAVLAAGAGIALAGAVISAIIPAWRVKRLSLVDALAGR